MRGLIQPGLQMDWLGSEMSVCCGRRRNQGMKGFKDLDWMEYLGHADPFPRFALGHSAEDALDLLPASVTPLVHGGTSAKLYHVSEPRFPDPTW